MMLPLAFLQNIGVPELVIILLIALLIFGHKLPSVARSLGSSVSEFKKGVKDGETEAQKKQEQEQQPPQQQQKPGQPLSQIRCGACGTTYVPTAVGAPCPACGTKPGPPPSAAAEKN